MIRWVGLWVIVLLFDDPADSTNDVQVINLADSVVEIYTYPLFDSLGLLNGYQANIFTPICEKDKCYAVEILFTWDQIGRFMRYDTIPGQPLTKLDHDPFLEEDYEKLTGILRNPNSVLRKYKKEELVQDTRTSEVDGITGATIQEVKDNVIEGAVYSCFTLWHIANGSVVDSIQEQTMLTLDHPLVEKLVAKEDQVINYFLIHRFSETEFEKYLPQILKTIETGRGYYPKNAIERIPGGALHREVTQDFFATHFTELNYFSQISLLKKLESEKIKDNLKSVLKSELEERSSYKNDLINQLIDKDNIN